mmetsp:Transcript_23190/g.41572  ORF Transcript_23190/g.41572 Transcript_23190/m.41572 type:complete len:484 (+) Transcript_23190:164-1615(+)
MHNMSVVPMKLLILFVVATHRTCHAYALSREPFSVAPMMAHTNRHYHTFFRYFSENAHLYTEMIPSETIVNLFNSNKELESNEALQELLGINAATKNAHNVNNSMNNRGPLILQLGGRDPQTLALASEIGVRMGYNGINLNCGCPSSAVSGRANGCALMRDPSHVAECVERMSESIANAAKNVNEDVELSVKHRLGVRDAATYDAEHDQQQTDDEAYQECQEFIQTITENSNVQKLQVHARLGLLGDFTPERTETLWTPDSSEQKNKLGATIKIDHKREQYKAKKLARISTIQNRSVPPLRPNVVNRLSENYPHLDFVTNGGIKSMEDIHHRVDGTNVMGAMLGRSVINHPCSFTHVDGLWGDTLPKWTREDVIQAHIQYCIQEEERCKDKPFSFRTHLRKKLVAVPFALFAGEEGNNAYQRQIRKMGHRLGRHTASAILQGALTHVPSEVRAKPITDFSSLDSIQTYSEHTRRSGPLQRAIS